MRGRYRATYGILQQHTFLVFAVIFASSVLLKIILLSIGGPGTDLTGSDIPKSLMLLREQNRYSVNPSSSPYPPFLLLVDALIIWVTRSTSASVSVIASDIRIAGLVTELGIGLLIYLTLRAREVSVVGISLSSMTFLLWFSSANYFFFHSDVFGMLLLAGSLYALVKNRFWIGGILLGFAAIFKLHPVLAIPLFLVWQTKRRGLVRTAPIIITLALILLIGLILPFQIPGYARSMLGWNLQVGDDANGKNDLTLMNLLYGIFPKYFQVSLSPVIMNDVWLLATAALLLGLLGFVWLRANTIGAVEIVLLGLAVWLIPLRQQHPHYVLWLFVPLLMLGKSRMTILVAGLFDLAALMNLWLLNIFPNALSWMDSVTAYFLASLVLASCSVISLSYVLKNPNTDSGLVRSNSLLGPKLATTMIS